MKRELWWRALDAEGLEQLRLTESETGVVAESTILRADEATGEAFHLAYRLECGAGWRVRRVELELIGSSSGALVLQSDGAGRWTDGGGRELQDLAGCLDVDISATPLTNTLPLRRLTFEIGQTAEIEPVYLLVPEMTVARSRQRYTRTAENAFLFEELGLFRGFAAEIETDEQFFVRSYPQLFKRL